VRLFAPAVRRRLLGTVVLVGGLCGCGAHTVAGTAFMTRGNAVCAVAAKRIAALATLWGGRNAAPERFAGYVDDYVAEMRLELANLRAIGYPPGERAALDDDYEGIEVRLDAAERDPLTFRPDTLRRPWLALGRAGLPACGRA
jgi:hypothetical protein